MSFTHPSRYRTKPSRASGPDHANTKTWHGVTTAATNKHLTVGPYPSESEATTSQETDYGFVLSSIDVLNGSGSDCRVYAGGRFRDNELVGQSWRAGQWDDSSGGNDYTDDTTDAQDSGAGDFPLQTTTNNDGWVVYSTKRFNTVVASVTTPSSGGGPAPVHEYRYWNGSAWTDLSMVEQFTFGSHVSLGEHPIIWSVPGDWALSTLTGPAEGIPAGVYAMRVRATTAPSTGGGPVGVAAVAGQLFVGYTGRWTSLLVPAGGAVHDAGLEAPLCSLSEAPWAVLTQASVGHRIVVVGEQTPATGIIGG